MTDNFITPNASTDGSFPKTWKFGNGERWLYKIQSSDATRSERGISRVLMDCGWDAAKYQYVGSYRTRIPWEKPWISAGNAVSHATGKPYSLLNQMLLGRPGEYVTFNQCQQEGGKVRKGEKAQMVVFWKWIEEKDPETEEVKQIPFLRYFNVFHIDQCEGLTEKHTQKLPGTANADQTAEAIIDGYIRTSGVRLHHEAGDQAFYRPSTDSITLPLLAQFKETAEYYSTAFHEMVHSTGHKTRLDRLEKTAFFGSEAYSKEELIAEIGAATLVNHAGLETSRSFRNSAAYVQNWLLVLRNDKRFIVSAAGKAEKAISLILNQ